MTGISVIIPAGDASRENNVQTLIADLQAQSVPPTEIQVVRGVSPNGKARNRGVHETTGDVLVFLDDDVRLGSPHLLRDFAACLARDPTLGMVGASQRLPPDSSAFQRHCAEQISRSQSAIVEVLTDSDMVTTACCAMRRDVFQTVGEFHDRILRGVDPEMRQRVRQANYRICVMPQTWFYHPMPSTLRALCRMAWRNGQASKFALRHFPATVIFNPEGHTADFDAHPSLLRRVMGKAGTLLGRIGRGQWYGALYDMTYIAGYMCG